MSADLADLAWPAERLGEAMEALAHAAGLAPEASGAPRPAGLDLGDDAAIAAWIEHAAAGIGVEAEPVAAPHGRLAETLRLAGPALVRVPGPGAARFLALAGRGRRAAVLAPDRSTRRVPPAALAELLGAALEAPHLPEIDALLARAEVRGRRLARARRALLRERVGAELVEGIWILRLPPGAGVRRQIAEAGLGRRALVLLGAYAVSYALWLLAWWTAGRGVLEDQLDRGWLLGWALVLLAIIPFRLLTTWSAGLFAVDAARLLKQRLLAGALALAPEEVRREGAGRLLGRAIESEAVESLALGGGILAITASMDLLASVFILAQGAGGSLHALLLVAWIGAGLSLAAGYLHRRGVWSEARLDLTHDLVERMVGHRTRLAQEPREAWHTGEDEALGRYLDTSVGLDRSYVLLTALVPRGWLLVGALGLAPAFVTGTGTTGALAVALGGILLAFPPLKGLTAGLSSLASAAIAWRQVAPLFRAAARVEPRPALPPPRPPPEASGPGRVLLEAHELVFRHRARARPVVRGASLRLAVGDRVLLEGPSGGGKSTLSSLLAGLREPESGLLLLDGLDRGTLGAAAWRRRVAAAPQFHENHVLTGTFAFNLLMGRRWPPAREDLAEAAAICDELGLGELVARMPAGLEQMVGETGWQLSHGEKSRLYMARALLQGGEIVVLDESFAALDPETLARALRCVLARAKAVVVVAHP
jgi:ATP-binding cassette subfamily B protein